MLSSKVKVHDRSQSLLNGYDFALTNDEQIDWLTGNGGSDVFVLGEITGKVFYRVVSQEFVKDNRSISFSFP
ncbi:hypothetical protein [Leptolyngbya sp. FACHB-541]|uniref:hypothetical protein n=1 Tax=Leptolyngbya sp. FACHB-541 TaxID=2692810 RepID=UPI001688ED10|nr:hypothetical protein [Leptolyngbya sp. FACHB-541]